MITSLLSTESPELYIFLVLIISISILLCYYTTAVVFCIILLFLLYFYRHEETTKRYPDNYIVSPAYGKVTNIIHTASHTYISIFLSPLDVHTQIYPVNGRVIKRIYDTTGIFGLATDIDKCRNNEKKIHYIQMTNGYILKLTQIAGFLPRRISSDDTINTNVEAGEYLGIIKFGSRVDILYPHVITDNNVFNLQVKVGDVVTHDSIIGWYD